MYNAKPRDEHVTEGGISVCQRATFGVVLGLLPRLVANVLQHGHIAVAQSVDHASCRLPHNIVGQLHIGIQQLRQPLRGRGQRVLRIDLTLRTA